MSTRFNNPGDPGPAIVIRSHKKTDANLAEAIELREKNDLAIALLGQSSQLYTLADKYDESIPSLDDRLASVEEVAAAILIALSVTLFVVYVIASTAWFILETLP